jgi:hypothetical protein
MANVSDTTLEQGSIVSPAAKAETKDAQTLVSMTSLKDFLQNTQTELQGKNPLSVETFFAQALQYKEFVDYFEAQPTIAARLATADAAVAKQLMLDICTNPTALLRRDAPAAEQSLSEMKQAEMALSNRFPAEVDVQQRQFALEKATQALKKQRSSQFARMEPKVKNFVDELRSRRLYGTDQEAEAIKKALTQPIYGLSLEEIHKETKRRISQAANIDEKAASKIIDDALSQTRLDEDLAAISRLETAATQVVLKNTDVLNTDIIVDAVVSGRTIPEAVNLAKTVTVVRQNRAQGGGGASFGKAANEVITEVFPGLTQANIPSAFAQAWNTAVGTGEKAEAFVGRMSERMGKDLVRENLDQLIQQGGNLSFQAKPQRFEGLGGFFSSPRFTPSDVDDYAEALLREGHATLDPQEFIIAQLYKRHADHAHWEFDSPLQWILELSTKKETTTTATAAVSRVGLGAWSGKAITQLGAGILTRLRFPTFLVSLAGGPVGLTVFAVTIVLPYVWDWARRGFGKIMSALGAGGIVGVSAMTRAFAENWASFLGQMRTYQDPVPLWAVAVGIPVVVFLLIYFSTSATINFVWRSRLQPGPVGGGAVPIVDCRETQTNPICNGTTIPEGVDCNATQTNPQCRAEACVPEKPGDCLWPTTGYITQGPHPTACPGNSSHESMDALDIGAAYNTPIIAVKGGTVTKWVSGCADQPLAQRSKSWGCNGGWGNYIEISSPDGYVIRYAHIALQSMQLTSPGKPVVQGSQIGKVDNNGNSTGNHLHFEVVSGPGSVLSIVPLEPHEVEAVNNCVGTRPGCAKTCPIIHTSIH